MKETEKVSCQLEKDLLTLSYVLLRFGELCKIVSTKSTEHQCWCDDTIINCGY